MPRNKITIIHYNPIEQYPPVQNDILDIIDNENISLRILTSKFNGKLFKPNQTSVQRIGLAKRNFSISRYLHYIIFNLSATINLLYHRPDFILAYETLSIFPIFVYNKIFKKSRIHIHYHEYTSKIEVQNASKYYQFLNILESKLYNKASITFSHTNQERIDLWSELKNISKDVIYNFPNLPPSYWYQQAKLLKSSHSSDSEIIKLVHIGAVGFESLYLNEILEWVKSQNGKFSLAFYISSFDTESIQIIDNYSEKCDFITSHKAINYYELPELLSNFHIGLSLYNGCIPNHTYSVPNKVMEYLICGLEVWYSDKLVSTNNFTKECQIKGCYSIDFSKITVPEINMKFNENHFFTHQKKIEKIDLFI